MSSNKNIWGRGYNPTSCIEFLLFPDLLLGLGLLDSGADIVYEQSEKRPSLLHCMLLPEGKNTFEWILAAVILQDLILFIGERY